MDFGLRSSQLRSPWTAPPPFMHLASTIWPYFHLISCQHSTVSARYFVRKQNFIRILDVGWSGKGDGDRMLRITVNLPDDIAEKLRELSRKRGASYSGVIRRAILTEAFLDEETDQGSLLLLKQADGEIRQVVWL